MLALDRFHRLEAIVTMIGFVSALVWCVASLQLWPGLDVLANRRVAQLLLITHGCDFALGVLIWAAAGSGWTRWRILAATVCFAGALLQIDRDARFVVHELNADGLLLHIIPPTLIFGGFIALFLASVYYNDTIVRRLGRGVAVIRSIGLSTYPLYLLHSFVGALAMRLAHAVDMPPGACLASGIAVALGASFAVSELVEPRLRAALRQVIQRKTDRSPAIV